MFADGTLRRGGHRSRRRAQGGRARGVPARRSCRRASSRASTRRARSRRSRTRGPTAATSARSRSIPTPAPSRSMSYVIVDDVGTVINPVTLKGQIHGGVAQGVGQALMEQVVYEPGVGPAPDRARSWTTRCRAPTRSATCTSRATRCPTKLNPMGAKGAGEAGTVGALPVVINAVMTRSRRSACASSTCRPRPTACGRPSRTRQRARLNPRRLFRETDAPRCGQRPDPSHGAHAERLASDAGHRRPAPRDLRHHEARARPAPTPARRASCSCARPRRRPG